MGFACQLGRAEDAVALSFENVIALVEVHARSTLFHVTTPFGRSTQKAVALRPPCFVRTRPTGCTDDTVALVPPKYMGALTVTTFQAQSLPHPMLANTRLPRTAFHTTLLRPPSPVLLLSMRTPQMLMALWTLARMLSMFARFRRHFRQIIQTRFFSSSGDPTIRPFFSFHGPATGHRLLHTDAPTYSAGLVTCCCLLPASHLYLQTRPFPPPRPPQPTQKKR